MNKKKENFYTSSAVDLIKEFHKKHSTVYPDSDDGDLFVQDAFETAMMMVKVTIMTMCRGMSEDDRMDLVRFFMRNRIPELLRAHGVDADFQEHPDEEVHLKEMADRVAIQKTMDKINDLIKGVK